MNWKNGFKWFRRKQIESREIARLIGEFYLNKNKNNYKKTEEELRTLGVVQIQGKDNAVIITLQRPGLLIGRRGENIDQLQKFLSSKTKYSKIDIKEDKVICWLIPYDYSDYQDWDFDN